MVEEPTETTSAVLDALVSNHRRFLDFLEKRIGSRTDAEELLQSAFLKGIEKAGDIRDSENAVAWFYRLLRNALIDYYRHRDVERRAVERQVVEAAAGDVVDMELEDTVCECIKDLLPTLKTEYSDVIQRADLDGSAISEIAKQTDTTPNNVRVRLHRARRALRKKLQLACGTCADHGCLDCTCGGAPGENPRR